LIACTIALAVDLAALLKVEKAQFKAVRSELETERPAVGFVPAQLGGYHFWGLSTTGRRDGEKDAQCGYLSNGGILSRVKEWVGEALPYFIQCPPPMI
jgi:hypothetical protein